MCDVKMYIRYMSIIKEDAGSHFDPNVEEAFIQSSDRVREVMDYFNEQNNTSD